jgi:hypothetical protein
LKALFWLAPIVLLAGCVLPPIVFQDGLPAYAPTGPLPEARGGFSGFYWVGSGTGSGARPLGYYFHGGLRMGQALGRFALEEGIDALPLGENTMVGAHLGVGLRKPSLILRGSYYPLFLNATPQFTLSQGWWQLSALVGSQPKRNGFMWSAGANASRLGIGPTGIAEYCIAGLKLRGQLSLGFRPPWVPDSAIVGQLVTLGVTAAFQP